MTSSQDVYEWLAVLFVVTGLLLAYFKAGKYWHNKFHHADPLEPAVEPYLPAENHEHRFSLRRMK